MCTPRAVVLLVSAGLFAAACGDDERPRDAGTSLPDAGMPDTGTDAGPTTPCGSATCTSDQYCYVNTTGPCVPNDGGPCTSPEELCQQAGVSGCTSPYSRECRVLPAACASGSCACLISQNLCPQVIVTNCNRPAGEGSTVSCPFP